MRRPAEIVSTGKLPAAVSSYDVIGDIAIVAVPEELTAKEQGIAAAILASNRRIKVVLKKSGNYSGEFRTVPLQFLAGENRQETEVKEFGVRLRVNPGAVYYSVRSGNERRRIASLVAPEESVLVLFSGIAPFPLQIALHSQAKMIVGIEKNPLAHQYGCENLGRNRSCSNIHLYLGDVREVLPRLAVTFDRVIMPLPVGGEEFLSCALDALKNGGSLHFYDMQQVGMFCRSVEKIAGACTVKNRPLVSHGITKCGHCGPTSYRICVDAVVG